MSTTLDTRTSLSPQIREVYEALIESGHVEEALDLAKKDMDGELDPLGVEVSFDYLLRKKVFIRNLWIHVIAKKLEDLNCARMEQPCNGCLSIARKIGPVVWKIMESWHDHAKGHWYWTEYQALEALEEQIKFKTTPAALSAYNKQHTDSKPNEPDLRIQKAPTLED